MLYLRLKHPNQESTNFMFISLSSYEQDGMALPDGPVVISPDGWVMSDKVLSVLWVIQTSALGWKLSKQWRKKNYSFKFDKTDGEIIRLI